MAKKRRFKIRDKFWTITLLPISVYAQTPENADSVAITHTNKRQIYFNTDNVDIGTVRHELFHAYCNELYLGSANISVTDFEEIIAEFLSENILEFEKKAQEILAWLRKGLSS